MPDDLAIILCPRCAEELSVPGDCEYAVCSCGELIRRDDSVRIWIPGIPQPGGSKKAFVIRGTNRAVVTEDCRRSKDWRAVVALKATETIQSPFDGAVTVTVQFLMLRPKSHFGKRGLLPSAPVHHTVRPDATKMWRATEDALKGIAWRDDSQVVEQRISKRYAESPGAWITIEPVAGDRAGLKQIHRREELAAQLC